MTSEPISYNGVPLKRLYRFMNAENGLRSLRDRRLRIGRIEELNDDFEFLGIALHHKEDRITLRKTRQALGEARGVLCMSETWESPLMWAHYADSHKGMVLGFDVPVPAYQKVRYIDKRPTLASLGITSMDEMTAEHMGELIGLKSSGWEYEREWRAYVTLDEGVRLNGTMHYFVDFGIALKLREVIVGLRFQTQRSEVERAVGDASVDLFMARGDFDDFKVVRQHQDSMWR